MDSKEIKRKLTSLKKVIKDKKKYKIRRLIEKIYITSLQFVFSLFPKKGVNIMREDWKYLIILDACRYDTFKRNNTIPGDLQKKTSLGSGTREWLKENFKEYYEDLIYISANPFASDHRVAGFKGSEHFFKVENVWSYGWDKEVGTVPPKNVTDAAIKMIKKYPEKRMIIHYMQPHGPWLGENGLTAKDINIENVGGEVNNFLPVVSYFWDEVKFGNMSIEVIKKAYEGNLKFVLKEVERLINHLDEKIVVTADHGTVFGKWGIYFHPRFIRIKDLIEIPWFVIKKGKRPSSKTDEKNQKNINDKEEKPNNEEEIKQRLASLGYI